MKHCSQRYRDREGGYALLVLLLFMAVLSMSFAVVIQKVEFEMKRDREEELIHRGAQYSRAVRKFIKAFGRYPNGIEELENTNNTRFLRKRYKDPITGKDFKILHLSDLPGFKPIAGGVTATSVAVPQGGFSRAMSDADKEASVAEAGGSAGLQSSQSKDADATGIPSQTVATGADITPRQQTSALPISRDATRESGKGPMVGVASISKTTTIREFNHKNHYNDWQFVYDPSTDRGGLLMTPNQPALQRAVALDGQSNPSSVSALGGVSAQGNFSVGVQVEAPSPQSQR